MAGLVDLLYPLRYSVGLLIIHRFILPLYRPSSLKERKYSSFDNISISVIHSVITAVAAVACILHDNSLPNKLEMYNNDFAMAIIKFSYAYFVYDMYDMLRMNSWNPL